jgi:DNA-nicking Smr family endonuclease
MSRQRRLTDEDLFLWRKVERTVMPMHKQRVVPDTPETGDAFRTLLDDAAAGKPVSDAKRKKQIRSAVPTWSPPPQPRKPDIERPIDRPTSRKIAKGRLSIDARIDLHAMTQDQAYDRLYGFLAEARSRGHRHVLVVTGKGRSIGSEGVLKRMVPVWLKGGRFAELVSGYTDAAPRHGGDGAIYIRLRKLTNFDGSSRS